MEGLEVQTLRKPAGIITITPNPIAKKLELAALKLAPDMHNDILTVASNVTAAQKIKITKLVEDAFGKTLASSYFDAKIKKIIYQQDYEGAAIIKEIDGVNYLDKFAVVKARQGNGLGKKLFSTVTEECGKFVWRASPENYANKFYAEKADGMMKKNGWNIYWIGLDENEVKKVAEKVANLEKTVI